MLIEVDAMIPYTEFERNGIFLGLGFIPMVLSCVFLIKAFDIKTRIKRLLIFVPGIITGIPFIYGVGMLIVMLLLGIKDVISSYC